MAGDLVPLVLLPRYSTFAGLGDYTTIAMDVTEYDRAIVNVWRRVMLGTTPSFALYFQESTDQDNWVNCQPTGVDPGDNTEAQYSPYLTRRWFRIKLTLGGTFPVVTCWAVGALERRTD